MSAWEFILLEAQDHAAYTWNRVVVAHDFYVPAVSRSSGVCHKDSVEREVLREPGSS